MRPNTQFIPFASNRNPFYLNFSNILQIVVQRRIPKHSESPSEAAPQRVLCLYQHQRRRKDSHFPILGVNTSPNSSA